MKLKKMKSDLFGMRLKELRTEKFKTMDEFCTRFSETTGSCINHSTVSRWESGSSEPVMSSLIMLADFFCVSPDFLMGRTTNRLGYPDAEPLPEPPTLEEQMQDVFSADELEALKLYMNLSVRNKAKAIVYLSDLADSEGKS